MTNSKRSTEMRKGMLRRVGRTMSLTLHHSCCKPVQCSTNRELLSLDFSPGGKSDDCQTSLWTRVPGLPLQTQVPGLCTETQVPFTHAPSLLASRLWHCTCSWTLTPSLLVHRPWLHTCLCTLPPSLPRISGWGDY